VEGRKGKKIGGRLWNTPVSTKKKKKKDIGIPPKGSNCAGGERRIGVEKGGKGDGLTGRE